VLPICYLRQVIPPDVYVTSLGRLDLGQPILGRLLLCVGV